jgi:hypothetical protein
MTNTLVKLDRVRRELAEASTLKDVKKIRDVAEAARTYAKAAHLGREAQFKAAELALLAAYKAGTILKQLPRAKPKAKGGRVKDSDYWRTLHETNTPYRTAQRWQAIAAVTEESLGRYFAYARKKESGEISVAGLLRALNKHLSRKTRRTSPFTRHISIPLKEPEYQLICDWASKSFAAGEFLAPEQRFIRECLSEFFRETGMALPLEETGAIRDRLAAWLAREPVAVSE